MLLVTGGLAGDGKSVEEAFCWCELGYLLCISVEGAEYDPVILAMVDTNWMHRHQFTNRLILFRVSVREKFFF